MADNQTFAKVNKEYFDGAAEHHQYDSKPWQKELIKQIMADLRSHMDWMRVSWAQKTDTNGKLATTALDPRLGEVKMLDYACGLGVASEALWPYVTQIKGVDVSRNMVKEYNYRAESRGIRSEDVFAIQGNIVDATESADLDKPDYFNFDVVVLNAALHHMENPALAVQRLANRLVPGKGVLVISDFIASEGSTGHDTINSFKGHQHKHQASHTVAHGGFRKEQMERMFRDAGCTEFDYNPFDKPYRFGDETGGFEGSAFIARGRRAG